MLHKHLAELLHVSIDQVYGHLPAEVFKVLAGHGRLTSAGVRSLLGWSIKEVQSALVILVQQHLALRYMETNYDKPSETRREGSTFYAVNVENAYAQTIRAGKALEMAAENFGEPAADLILNLLRYGHVKVSELEAAYDVPAPNPASAASTRHQQKKGLKMKAEPGDPAPGNQDVSASKLNGESKTFEPKEHGGGKSTFRTNGQLHTVLDELLCAGLIIPVHEIIDYWPLADRLEHLKNTLKPVELREGKTQKAKQEQYEVEVKEQQQEWQADADRFFTVSRAKNPRPKEGARSHKKAKTDGSGAANGVNGHRSPSPSAVAELHESAARVESNIELRVNHEKVEVYMRDEFLKRMVHRYIGETTSRVFAAMLHVLNRQTLRCVDHLTQEVNDAQQDDEEEEESGIMLTASQIEAEIDASLDLRHGLNINLEDRQVNCYHDGKSNGVRNRDFAVQPAGVQHGEQDHIKPEVDGPGQNDSESESDDPESMFVNGNRKRKHTSTTPDLSRISLVRQHLDLLVADPHEFVKKVDKEFCVPIARLTRRLQQAEVENTITARYGYLPAAVLRMLRAKGKLEEKQVIAMSMVGSKEARTALGCLVKNGFVDSQEVPRDTNRSVNKAAYLYSYNPLSCRQNLLATTYKTMTRLLLRIDVESEKRRTTIDKAERSDVREMHDQYLTRSERSELQQWREVEQRLLVQVGRCDDLVAILRDFLPEEYIPTTEEDVDDYKEELPDDEDEVMAEEVEEEEGEEEEVIEEGPGHAA